MFSNNKFNSKLVTYERLLMEDVSKIGRKTSNLFGLSELNVTEVNKQLEEINDKNSTKINLTTYLLYCYIKTIKENLHIQGIRSWWYKIYFYNDIDLCIPIELENKTVDPKIIRNANRKTIFELREEILKTKQNKRVKLEAWQKWSLFLPGFIKQICYALTLTTPILRKHIFGTAYFSTLNLKTCIPIAYIPLPLHPVGLFLGSTYKQEISKNGTISLQEIMPITISIDHSINDGVPLHNFINCFNKNVVETIEEFK